MFDTLPTPVIRRGAGAPTGCTGGSGLVTQGDGLQAVGGGAALLPPEQEGETRQPTAGEGA